MAGPRAQIWLLSDPLQRAAPNRLRQNEAVGSVSKRLLAAYGSMDFATRCRGRGGRGKPFSSGGGHGAGAPAQHERRRGGLAPYIYGAAARIAARRLDVTVGIGADPYVRPGRRYRQLADAQERILVGDGAAVGGLVGEAGALRGPANAGLGVGRIRQPGGAGIRSFIDFHSYSQLILTPWGFSCDPLPESIDRMLEAAAGTAARFGKIAVARPGDEERDGPC